MKDFIHLHVHNTYSLLDGMGTAEDYIMRAKKLGMSAIALTNHGNIDGCIKFWQAGQKENIKTILGCEFYIVPDINVKEKREKKGHITLLAKNEKGWQDIQKMITVSNIDGFYYRPRISPDILLNHIDNVVTMSACVVSFLTFPWGEDLLKNIIAANKENIYLEVMPHNFALQKEVNQLVLDYSRRYDLKLVATQDCHYVTKEDEKSQEVLLAIQTGKKWNDPDRWKFQGGEYYFKSSIEMSRAFRNQNILSNSQYLNAMANTIEVMEKCNFSLEKKELSLPRLPALRLFSNKDWHEDDEAILEKLCEEGFGKITVRDQREYWARYKLELNQIKEQKFTRYFLLVWELVKWARENDIMVGPARGSSAGSLVCYLLGITQVDPIKYGLLFARFISPDRIDIPDIDIDFEDTKRHLIREHLESLYGKWNVAGVSTFSEMRGKGAVRDASRVFAIPLKDVDKACTTIVSKLDGEAGVGETIKDAFNTFDDGIEFKNKYPGVADIAMRIEGNIRNKGQHAAAMVVADTDLRKGEHCALTLGKDKEIMVNWDKEEIEFMGLMKLDVLGLKMLTVLNDTKKKIKKNYNIDIDFDKIPLDDTKCYEEFNKGNTIGCFQIGSHGLRNFCKRMGVENFRYLTDINALFRPGTLRTGAADTFIKRKHGKESVPRQHPIIDKITKDTFGIILYQEQVMQLVHELAGLDWPIADKIRKVIGKSKGEEAIRKFEKQFVKGCVDNGNMPHELAQDLWEMLVSFGSYSFNKSHSVAYSMLAFWDMWLKLYYPSEFLCSLLTYGVSNSDPNNKKEDYIGEAFRLGLEVRPPKVGISDPYLWVEQDGVLYMPFIEIFGVGKKRAQTFANLKNKKGFFKKDESPAPRFIKVLGEINAYEDIPLDDIEAERIDKFLGTSLIKDLANKYKNLKIKLDKSFHFEDPKNSESGWYFGVITSLTLGLKKNSRSNNAYAYGLLRCNNIDYRISFGSDLYEKYKAKIEHCENELIIVEGNIKKSGIIAEDAFFMEDIFSCNFNTKVTLDYTQKPRFLNEDLLECHDCNLRDECTAPVLPSMGRNMGFILGEGPGAREDSQGKGFVGDSGDVLWKEISNYGHYRRRDFHITNTVKCWPSETKTPQKKHINSCNRWLEEEFKVIGPDLVLGLGNTAIKFFTEDESGIMQRNGKTEWNEKYGVWVCWCIHPASTLYSPDNITIFREGVKNFIDKVWELYSPF